MRFDGKHPEVGLCGLQCVPEDLDDVDHEERQGSSGGDWRLLGMHEVLQPLVLRGIAEDELDVEAQGIVFDNLGIGWGQIAAEQNGMGTSVRLDWTFAHHERGPKIYGTAYYAFDNSVLSVPLTRYIKSWGKHWGSELECSHHIQWQGQWRRVDAIAAALRHDHPESFRPVHVRCRTGETKRFGAFTKVVR